MTTPPQKMSFSRPQGGNADRETSYHRPHAENVENTRLLWKQVRATGTRRLYTGLTCLTLSSLLAIPQAAILAALVVGSITTQTTPEAESTVAGSLQTMLAIAPSASILLYPILVIIRAVLSYQGEIRMAEVSAAVRVNLRYRLFSRLLEKGPVYMATQESGDITTTLVTRVELLDGYITRYLPHKITATITLPLIIIALLFLSPLIAGMLLLAGLLAPFLMVLVGIMARRTSLKHQAQMGRLSNLFLDRLRNLELLRVFAAANSEASRLEKSANDLRHTTMKVLRVGFLTSTSIELLATFAIALGAIHLAGLDLPLYASLLAFLLIPEFFSPLRTLLSGYHDRMMALGSITYIRKILAEDRTGFPSPEPANTQPSVSPRLIERRLPEPVITPSIDVQNVTYTYPNRDIPALYNLSFHVAGSEFLALSGKSGAGKSTILSLLLGFITPDDGMLAIATHAIDAIDPEQRASLFAWVGQRTRLFHGTLRQNILFGNPSASEDEVRQAIEQAGLAPLIASLPDGLETLVGERGFGLSGGQAQRVAIARAFLRNAPVLLLDEPTTGLDEDISRDLMKTIRTLASNRTVLMVSHDPVALEAADRIIEISAPDPAFIAAQTLRVVEIPQNANSNQPEDKE